MFRRTNRSGREGRHLKMAMLGVCLAPVIQKQIPPSFPSYLLLLVQLHLHWST
jgi:hypothetical protein